MAEGREEAYVLRFVDAALAARVRSTLAEEPEADPADAHMELDFDGETVSFRVFSLTLIWSSSIRRKKLSLGPVSTKKKSRTERQLTPAGEARVGAFTIAGERYPVFLLDSPSIIEAYSSLDDVNLVKTCALTAQGWVVVLLPVCIPCENSARNIDPVRDSDDSEYSQP